MRETVQVQLEVQLTTQFGNNWDRSKERLRDLRVHATRSLRGVREGSSDVGCGRLADLDIGDWVAHAQNVLHSTHSLDEVFLDCTEGVSKLHMHWIRWDMMYTYSRHILAFATHP